MAAEEATGYKEFSFENKPDWVEMKYAFGIKGIPREKSNWVEVSYPYEGE